MFDEEYHDIVSQLHAISDSAISDSDGEIFFDEFLEYFSVDTEEQLKELLESAEVGIIFEVFDQTFEVSDIARFARFLIDNNVTVRGK